MGDAPFMKSLPGDVIEVQKDVAKFGSRLTDMESELAKSELDFQSKLKQIQQEIGQIQLVSFFFFGFLRGWGEIPSSRISTNFVSRIRRCLHTVKPGEMTMKIVNSKSWTQNYTSRTRRFIQQSKNLTRNWSDSAPN